MRILVIYPMFTRYARIGAEEQDSFACLRDLREMGHEAKLLVMNNSFASMAEAAAFFGQYHDAVEILPFHKQRWDWRRAQDIAFLDGAAWEYGQAHFKQAVQATIQAFQPDLIWARASFMWPAVQIARAFKIPVILRSVNFEPHHEFLWEGRWLPNQLRYWGKWISEQRCMKYADVLAAITPYEAGLYRQMGGRAQVDYLPLQSLGYLLRPPQPVSQRRPLRVFLMGASYTVSHNLASLELVVKEIAPRLRQVDPGAFEFHVLGTKIPQELLPYFNDQDVFFDGFAPDLEAHLAQMDIALMPSLFGQGMQQKIFESLCRGFPTLTNARALAGYPYEDGQHVLLAEDAEGFVEQLRRLGSAELRAQLAAGASQRSYELFQTSAIRERVARLLAQALQAKP